MMFAISLAPTEGKQLALLLMGLGNEALLSQG